jgi:hypothetical protein
VATKKQQRRKYERAVGRGRLHGGYEPEPPPGKPEKAPSKRRPGQPMPPSAARTAKRAVMFAALFYVVVSLTAKSSTTTQKVANAAMMFFAFWAIGLAVERYAWRRHLKKQGGPAA